MAVIYSKNVVNNKFKKADMIGKCLHLCEKHQNFEIWKTAVFEKTCCMHQEACFGQDCFVAENGHIWLLQC